MHSFANPQPLHVGISGKHDATLANMESSPSAERSPNTVYVHISTPHWPSKRQTGLDVQPQRHVRKSWLDVVRSSFYAVLCSTAIVASIVIFRLCTWNWYGESQAPLLSVPVQTSWRLLITPHVSCAEDPPFVALVTMSGAADAEGRKFIRSTWGGTGMVAGRRVRLFFVLGAAPSTSVKKALESEAAQHGDILQHAAPDKYSNLAAKTATVIQWMAASCPEAKFFVKADTDTLVNLPIMVPYLKRIEGKPGLALGVRIDGMPLVTDPRSRNYQDPLVYSRQTFPPYLSGACYVISGDLVKRLSLVLPNVPRLRNEDTFLGMCLERLGVEPRNIGAQAAINPWFDPAKGPCAAFRLAAAHAFRRDLMHAMWTWWHSGGAAMCH